MTDQQGHFFDVGAHIGIWTVPIALSRPRASVHAFEASPLTFAKLKQNITENKIRNITLNHSAVFSEVGSVTFQIPENASVFGRIYSSLNSRGRYDATTQVIVPAVTIDQYCKERGIDAIEFLKIDVEGAEFEVLKGCLRMLSAKKVRFLWIELDAVNQVDFHSSIDNIANLMDSVGYAFYRLADLKTPVNIRHDREGNMLACAYGSTP
jgi:FkbM family methyltransferase